ncbi:MAG: ABC transporter ATP-binding protein [Muribaculaceae bacterium]|nr:ABC transporter ATP-binding protein [Muribaculaceae bacterium]
MVSDISFELCEGSFTTLIGANGAGKSTLLRTLSGVQAPLGGVLSYKGRDIRHLSRRECARFVTMVSTERRGGAAFTVRETVSLGRNPHAGLFERLNGRHARAVDEALETVGITSLSDRRLGTLSDGERQKVMIATALAQATPFIILDEPTAFLDVAGRISVMKVLQRMANDGRTVLLSTHDIAPAIEAADNLWVIDPAEGCMHCGGKEYIVNSGIIDRAFPGGGLRFDPALCDFR